MSKIVSIATELPQYKIAQKDIRDFMLEVYGLNEQDTKRVELLYGRCGIDYRYSVLPDYNVSLGKRTFYPPTRNLEPFPSLEKRMEYFHPFALELSAKAIKKCISEKIEAKEITHLITVSCTGLSAPGLDLAILEELQLQNNIYRTSINFMGCYAAIHGLKLADSICKTEPNAKVIVVCTELCTLHFQKESEMDFITSSLLFGDGSATVLVTHDSYKEKGLHIKSFYSEVKLKGKKDMAWQLSSKGFLMTLSAYIPQLLQEDLRALTLTALKKHHLSPNEITHWAMHPGGKKILETFATELNLEENDLRYSYKVLKDYGNMSSPTVLFVLNEIMKELNFEKTSHIFAAAFGPGLTMETVLFSSGE